MEIILILLTLVVLTLSACLWLVFILKKRNRSASRQDLRKQADWAWEIINTMGQGLVVTDTQARFEFVNPAYARLTGYTPQQLQNLTVFDLTPPQEQNLVDQALEKRQSGLSTTYEKLLLRPDGTTMPVTITGRPRRHKGQIIGSVSVITELTEQKKTEQTLREQKDLLSALHQTSLDLMNRLELDDLLAAIIERAGTLIGTSHGFISLVDSDGKTIRGQVGVGHFAQCAFRSFLPGEGLAGLVWQTGQPIAITDYQSWPGRAETSIMAEARAVLCVPLLTDSKLVGVLGLAYLEEGRTFSSKDLDMLGQFARLAAISLDNARLYTVAQRRLSELTTIQEIARAISSNLGLEGIFETVVRQISLAFGYQMVSIYLLDEEGLKLQAYVGYDRVKSLIGLQEGVSGRAVRLSRAEFVDEALQDPDFVLVAPGTVQCVVIPLKSKGDEVLGTLMVESDGQPILTREDFTLLQLLGDQISVAISNARLFVELDQSQEKYREVLDTVKEVIFQTDQLGRWTFLNAAWQELLGYGVKETLGTFFLDQAQPEDRTANWKVLEDVLAGRTDDYRAELRFVAKDGSVKWLEAFGRAIRSQSALVLGLTGTLVDITHRKRAEEERLYLERKMLEAQKLESLGLLTGGVAHDFNNLLTTILANAELSRMQMSPDDPRGEALEEIEKAALQAADLTHQMLLFAGKGQFVMERRSLNLIIGEISQLVRASIKNKKITLKLNFTEDLPLIEADSNQIRQVVMNLVANAYEAIGDQEGTVSLSTGLLKADEAYLATGRFQPELTPATTGEIGTENFIYLEVRDSGSGMDEEMLLKIFDPFFTTKFTGRGLGLSAVQGIIRAHGATLRIESKIGQGTAFRVLFPVPPLLDDYYCGPEDWAGGWPTDFSDLNLASNGPGEHLASQKAGVSPL